MFYVETLAYVSEQHSYHAAMSVTESILEDAAAILSTRLDTVQFHHAAWRMFNEANYDPVSTSTLTLPVGRSATLKLLTSSNYPGLLVSLLARVEVLHQCRDVFSSAIEESLLSLLEAALSKLRHQVTVRVDESGGCFQLDSTDLLSDLLLPGLSQFHSEVVMTCDQFLDMVDIAGSPAGVFLQAHGATALSQFVQMWVAEALSIPLNYPGEGAIAVV